MLPYIDSKHYSTAGRASIQIKSCSKQWAKEKTCISSQHGKRGVTSSCNYLVLPPDRKLFTSALNETSTNDCGRVFIQSRFPIQTPLDFRHVLHQQVPTVCRTDCAAFRIWKSHNQATQIPICGCEVQFCCIVMLICSEIAPKSRDNEHTIEFTCPF